MAVDNVTNRAALAAIASPAGKVAFLMENGREGIFKFQAGNFTARVASDSLQGLYVPSSTVSTSSGCWVRDWDGVTGYPEWFGAQPNVLSFDCQPALTACVALCPTTQLQAAPYYIQQKWVINTAYRRVRGAGAAGALNNQGGVSIIVATFANDDAVVVGPLTQPTTSSQFPDEIDVANFDIARTVPRIPPSGGLVENGFAAMRVQYNKRCFVTNISNRDFSIGFFLRGAIYLKMSNCLSYISQPATTGTNDVWIGYYLQCQALSPLVGIAGGNASLYIDECSAILEGSPNIQDGIGMFLGGVNSGAYSSLPVDTYVTRFETGAVPKGVVLIGDLSNGLGNADIFFNQCVFDGCTTRGIEVNKLGGGGCVQFTQPYVTPVTATAQGILIASSVGAVSVIGGQINGYFSNDIGVAISASQGTQVTGIVVSNMLLPVRIADSAGFDVDVVVDSAARSSSTGYAVGVATSSRGNVKVKAIGAQSWSRGVDLDTASTGLVIDVGGIANGVTLDRIKRNGVAVTHQGNVNGHSIINPGTTITV